MPAEPGHAQSSALDPNSAGAAISRVRIALDQFLGAISPEQQRLDRQSFGNMQAPLGPSSKGILVGARRTWRSSQSANRRATIYAPIPVSKTLCTALAYTGGTGVPCAVTKTCCLTGWTVNKGRNGPKGNSVGAGKKTLLSLGLAHPLHQHLKASITSQVNKVWVLPDPDQVAHMHLLGFLQPVQCIFFIP